jgi:catechol 2,3-dioxygenase-like lactoylglutathione lyase family enzyme
MPTFDAIGLVTTDLERSLAFYRELGVPVPVDHDGGHVEATLGSGLRLMWDTVDVVTSFDADWQAPTGGHRCAFAFSCTDPAEVDAVYARMLDAGYDGHLRPWDAFWGQRYATLHDPDGNPVDLYAPLGD